MKDLHTLRNRLIESKAVGKLCAVFGIDPRQYRLLLDLFAVLSDRMEFMGMTFGLYKTVGWYFALSLFISVTAFVIPTLSGYLFLMIGYSMLSMLLILLMDAANSIMNPDEASVLAHQPIRGATYVAAKLTHVLVVVSVLIPALNLLPAIAGLYLREARWFYPLTHLTAAYLAGLFIAFFVCGIYGWCFLFISPAKLKNAALWLQLAMFFMMMMVNSIVIFTVHAAPRIISRVLASSWMPWRWFVAVGLIGHTLPSGFSPWEAIAACLITLALIAFGLRGFRADYMAKVSALVQGSAASAARSSRISWIHWLVRKITGAPSGYGAFSFVWIMLRRDWNFRRQALPIVASYLIVPLALLLKSIRISPFASGMFSPMHIFPHLLGMVLAVVSILLPYTAEPQGSSIFVPLPLGPLRSFVRGIYWSLWMPVVILHLCLLGPCMWFWGVAEGALFIGYSVAMASVYLGLAIFFIEGFPFANAFKPSTGKSLPIIFLFMLIPISIFGVIQWFVFRNIILALSAGAALVMLALAVGHFGLDKLEKKVRVNLQMLGFSPQQMFKELE